MGSEEVNVCFRALPCIGRQMGFVGTALGEELADGPAGFCRYLGQEAAGLVALGDIDAVDAKAKAQGVVSFFQRRKDGYFDVEGSQLGRCNGVSDKPRVLRRGRDGHLRDKLDERSVRNKLPDTAAESLTVFQSHEAATMSGQFGVVGGLRGRSLTVDGRLNSVASDF